jgi:pimeloyl-ACP methyl ester carboxylesterase
MPFFRHAGHRLAYTTFGDGPCTCVLRHGLLLSQKMHRPLARELAQRGNRVVTLDLLGHGRSARPEDMTQCSTTTFGEQAIALPDHLELRLRPERLTEEIAAFLDECWKPRGRGSAPQSERVA